MSYFQLFFQILLSLLSISSCLSDHELDIWTSSTTTEVSTKSEIVNENNDEEMPDDIAATDENEGDDTEESSKSKRTVERNFGYGFNDITSRLQGQANNQGKFRAYPYQQLRLHSTLRTAQDVASQQQQSDGAQRPYNTAHLSSLSNFNYRTGVQADSQEPVYHVKSSYQQVPTYRGTPAFPSSSNGAPVYAPGAPHAVPLFSGPPQYSPSFFTGNSLTSPHHHFPAVTPINLPNTLFSAGNFHGGPLVHQLAGSSVMALLHNPSGHFGPQILPVIILRVNNDPSGSNFLQYQSSVSPNIIPAGLHGLLYPAQHHQVSQQPMFSHFATTQTEEPPQLLYQERTPSGEIPKAQHIQPPAAATPQSSYVHQKKPLLPTPSPDSPQKHRKTIIVTETDPHSNSGYSQYKYGSKDKV
jgi:hypothetical protein